MLTIDTLMTLIGLCATFFSLGYAVGCNAKTKR